MALVSSASCLLANGPPWETRVYRWQRPSQLLSGQRLNTVQMYMLTLALGPLNKSLLTAHPPHEQRHLSAWTRFILQGKQRTYK